MLTEVTRAHAQATAFVRFIDGRGSGDPRKSQTCTGSGVSAAPAAQPGGVIKKSGMEMTVSMP